MSVLYIAGLDAYGLFLKIIFSGDKPPSSLLRLRVEFSGIGIVWMMPDVVNLGSDV